jgi:hypothetical protein
MIARITLLVLLLAVGEAHASDTQPFYVMGIGRVSCASWLSDRNSEVEGNAWILGFWSGGNFYSDDHGVGANTDPMGVLATIKKNCLDAPADSLIAVTAKTFKAFANEGR